MTGDGWRMLISHSYRLGGRWLGRVLQHRGRGARAAIQRVFVPLDPWRFYEMSRAFGEPYDGRWLDVSSPKLLMSSLSDENRGAWVGIDLFSREIRAWRELNPTLDLRVADARDLPFPDSSFDGCLCISVIEHVAGDGDSQVMEEMWRVLRPGGLVRLTTNVCRRGTEVFISDRRYDEASVEVEAGKVFFERRYDSAMLSRRLLGLPWDVVGREFVRMRDQRVQDRFFRFAPASYPLGFVLRWLCPGNFDVVDGPEALADGEMGVVYLTLRKPG